MKNILLQIDDKNRLREKINVESEQVNVTGSTQYIDRRNFLRKTALGGITIGGLINFPVEDTIAQTTSKVSRFSGPSDLKITDMRFAEKGNNAFVDNSKFVNRILRIDTNQGIYGLGDIRDGTDQRFALMFKSKIIGLNPCNVEMIFKILKQFGGPGRQGGGVSGVEMACWDICGKALGVPVWQLLGGRYRDKIRLCGTTSDDLGDPRKFGVKLKLRVEEQGFTWLKMSLGTNIAANKSNALVNTKYWSEHGFDDAYKGSNYMDYWNQEHPFTQVQITDKGLAGMAEYVEIVRNEVGYEIPLSSDHFGHMDMNQVIRIAKTLDKYRLAWMEDLVAWFYTDQLKVITDAIETPTITGEDIYMLSGKLGGFKKLIDAHAVDIINPDLISAGGILETKKIGDYAEENGIPMALHANTSPVGFMANVHCAAATENFLVLEHHDVDSWWEGLVNMVGSQPIITKGYANVPLDAPGLGIELNDENMKAHMQTDPKGYFQPTPEWDNSGTTYDKLWI
jgi:L-alanine-DL-glutamate epimerase-like enolase superfamily enzyme